MGKGFCLFPFLLPKFDKYSQMGIQEDKKNILQYSKNWKLLENVYNDGALKYISKTGVLPPAAWQKSGRNEQRIWCESKPLQ